MSLAEKQNIAEDIINQSVDSETSDDKASRNLKKLKERLDKLEKETLDMHIEHPSPSAHPPIDGQNKLPEDVEMQSLEDVE